MIGIKVDFRAYNPVCLDKVDLLVNQNTIVEGDYWTTISMEISEVAEELWQKIHRNGLAHTRVSLKRKEGMVMEVLEDEGQRRRILGFCLIVSVTERELKLSKALLQLYGFSEIKELKECYDGIFFKKNKKKGFKVKAGTPVRELVKTYCKYVEKEQKSEKVAN